MLERPDLLPERAAPNGGRKAVREGAGSLAVAGSLTLRDYSFGPCSSRLGPVALAVMGAVLLPLAPVALRRPASITTEDAVVPGAFWKSPATRNGGIATTPRAPSPAIGHHPKAPLAVPFAAASVAFSLVAFAFASALRKSIVSHSGLASVSNFSILALTRSLASWVCVLLK